MTVYAKHDNRRLHMYDNHDTLSRKSWRKVKDFLQNLWCRKSWPIMNSWVKLYTSCLSSSQRLFDYSNGTTPIHCQQARLFIVASSFVDWDQPTHHTIWWLRVDLYNSCLSSSQRLFDYSNGTTSIHCQQARQSSSTHVCQSQITQ